MWHLILIILGVAITICRHTIEISPHKIEYGYAGMIYPYISALLAIPARWIPAPHSASEFFFGLILFATLFWFVYQLQVSIRKKTMFTLALKMLIYAVVIPAGGYVFYLTSWGLNYLREPLSHSLNMDDPSDLSPWDYEKLATDMLTLVGISHKQGRHAADKADLEQMDIAVDRSLRKLTQGTFPFQPPPRTKVLFMNECLNVFGISGVFSPVFMEPHVNSDLLPWERPYIMAHEKAHFLGFASETDANLLAYLACLSAESDMLRYSAALHLLISLGQHLPREKLGMIKERLPADAREDISARYDRIRRNETRYSLTVRLGRRVNDTYLKLNSQKLGVNSYQAALPHLAAWWKKEGLIRPLP